MTIPSGTRRRGVLLGVALLLVALLFLAVVLWIVNHRSEGLPVADRVPAGAKTDERLLEYERRLEDASPTIRHAAVADLLRLAGDEPSLRGPVCDDLLNHVVTRLTWNTESDKHKGINVDRLDARSPDGAAALQGISTLHCTDFGGKVSLHDLDLRSWSLENGDLPGAVIHHSHLGNSDLTNANLAGADLTWDVLHHSTLRSAVLSGARLEGADMSEAKLNDTDLSDAKLGPFGGRRALLVNADLAGAILSGADLRWAGLEGANLTGADLTGADLAGATADRRTRWPAGFDPVPAGVRLS
jgi:uncharacterized protein YjbI with pentapeptide repeats